MPSDRSAQILVQLSGLQHGEILERTGQMVDQQANAKQPFSSLGPDELDWQWLRLERFEDFCKRSRPKVFEDLVGKSWNETASAARGRERSIGLVDGEPRLHGDCQGFARRCSKSPRPSGA